MNSVVVVSGAGGLIGSETAGFFAEKGFDVVGIDNDMRSYFFGPEASTRWRIQELQTSHRSYSHRTIDIRDFDALDRVFKELGRSIATVIHAAAQPSHDWAAREPFVDFGVNAAGTLNMLEATRRHAPEAGFIFLSTNKVYGDRPNQLPLVEQDTRFEIDPGHRFAGRGIDESMSIDQSTHSLFGVSKVAADLMVQEYGRYFGLKTTCLRCGCLTGGGHSGAELHGFLSYLMKCTVTGTPYTVFGYKAKQVRDNIHSSDVVRAIWMLADMPPVGAVYNLGGGYRANCSMIEAIALCEEISGRTLSWTLGETNRVGDHIWWISDISALQRDFPGYQAEFGLRETLEDIHDKGRHRWLKEHLS